MKSRKKGVRYGTVFFILVTAVILTAICTYFYVSSMVSNLGRNQQIYSKLNKVNDLIDKNYILTLDPVNGTERVLDGIVEGYINSLGDPYSYYLNETNYRISSNAADASGVGIGVLTTYDKATGGVAITFVKRNSPAEAAGLKIGDVITAVNGTAVTELGFRNAVSMLSGAEGSDVILTYVREGEPTPVVQSVTRETYDPQTVQYRLLESGSGIGYIYINEFASSTVSEFSAAIESLRDMGSRGFIIDVRFNAGGDFTAMSGVLDKVMAAGIMCSIQELAEEQTKPYYSDEAHLAEKIVVLQNFATSDVAEVFSAALKDTNTAMLIGDTTYGKGVGQRDIPLSDGSAIHISTFAYVTPNGEEFNGVGISPDVSVSLSEEKVLGFRTLATADDDQLQAAVAQMRTLLGGA